MVMKPSRGMFFYPFCVDNHNPLIPCFDHGTWQFGGGNDLLNKLVPMNGNYFFKCVLHVFCVICFVIVDNHLLFMLFITNKCVYTYHSDILWCFSNNVAWQWSRWMIVSMGAGPWNRPWSMGAGMGENWGTFRRDQSSKRWLLIWHQIPFSNLEKKWNMGMKTHHLQNEFQYCFVKWLLGISCFSGQLAWTVPWNKWSCSWYGDTISPSPRC